MGINLGEEVRISLGLGMEKLLIYRTGLGVGLKNS